MSRQEAKADDMEYISRVYESIRNNPKCPILADDASPGGISREKLWETSGRIYNYLKSHGIGKEDFVMICLPRGIFPIIAEVAVWRAGAAFVLVEDNYAPERIEYIRKDCSARLVFDINAWEEAISCESLEGWEKTGEHDAAFAVYTSGTTGSPKGVLHEYGNIERMSQSTDLRENPYITNGARFALVAPLNFIATLLVTVGALTSYNGMLFVVPYATVKNPLSIGMYLIKNRINGTFLTPSYAKGIKKKPPMLNMCILGSEPADGVFLDGLTLHNVYAMSESGFIVCHYIINKKYDRCPVGKNDFGLEIGIVDSEGNPVKDGESGELVFDNRYVRGYIGLPEETAKHFRNGYYYSGDLGYRTPEGDIVLCGRMSDMVKINGNRVEPGEIECVAAKVLGVNTTAVRIFHEKGKYFICVYYTEKKKVDFESTRKKMEEYLPYYMLPSFFIHIDGFPKTQSGKLNRKALPAPDFSEYRDTYEAPGDDIEKVLCSAFEKVLETDRVGINDDFYQLGGDSMSSMEILTECALPGLSTSDIFRGHTPARIARIYRESGRGTDGLSDDERDDLEKGRPHRLTAYQTYIVDYQFYTPKSTMYNLFTMFSFDRTQLDTEKMARTVEKAISGHPGMMTRLYFSDEGEILQIYDSSYLPHIEVEKVSEEELEQIKKTLVQPFRIARNPLYRVRIFETEKKGYLFFDIHHTIFDGTSFKVLIRSIFEIYCGTEPERDYYFGNFHEIENILNSERYLEDKKYFDEKFEGRKFVFRPAFDHETRDNRLAHASFELSGISEKLTGIEKRFSIGRNAFFTLASLIALSVYSKAKNTMLTWTYNGRDDLRKMNSTGLYLADLPVGIEFSAGRTAGDLFGDVSLQIKGGIEHSSFPYTISDARCVTDDMICFLYQQDIRDGGDYAADLGIEPVSVTQNNAASENVLDIQVLDGNEGLSLVLDYAASLYDEESIMRYGRIFTAAVRALLRAYDDENITYKKLVRMIGKETGERSMFLRWLR